MFIAQPFQKNGSYSDSELENRLHQEHQRCLSESDHRGKTDGLLNLPSTMPESNTEFIDQWCDDIAFSVSQRLEPELHREDGAKTLANSKIEDSELHQKVIDKEQELNLASKQIGNKTNFPYLMLAGIIVFTLIFFADAEFTANSFQTITDSFFRAMIFAIGSILSLGLFKKYFRINLFPQRLNHLNQKLKHIMIFCFIIILSMLRIEYFEKTCDCDVNDLYILGLGLLAITGLYLSLVHLIIPYFPKLKQWYKEFNNRKMVKRLDKQKKALENQRKTHSVNTLTLLREKKSIILYHDLLQSRIEIIRKQCKSAYWRGYYSIKTKNQL